MEANGQIHAPAPAPTPSKGNETKCSLNRKPGGFQSQSVCFREGKKLLSLTDSNNGSPSPQPRLRSPDST